MNEQAVKPCKCGADTEGPYPVCRCPRPVYTVECGVHCGEYVLAATANEAIQLWNRRASPEPSPSVREAAEKAFKDMPFNTKPSKEGFIQVVTSAFRDFVPVSELQRAAATILRLHAELDTYRRKS